MKRLEETESFFDKANAIPRKFMESLITGQRDPIFGVVESEHSSESDEESYQSHIDSQRGTF